MRLPMRRRVQECPFVKDTEVKHDEFHHALLQSSLYSLLL